MELVLVAISLASLVCNVVLVRKYTATAVSTGLEPTENLLPPIIVEQTDAAEEVTVEEPAPTPAAVPAVQDNSPWVNRTGIQQGVNAAPAPPIKPPDRPPLARPDGFVR